MKMKINIIIPELDCSLDTVGFDEMLASEIRAKIKSIGGECFISIRYPISQADCYIYTIQYRSDVFSDWLKNSIEMTGNKPTIVCGKSGAVERRYLLEECNVKYVIMGEAEKTLESFIMNFYDFRNLHNIKGIAFLQDGIVKETELQPAIEDLDTLPFPEYEYLRMGDQYYPLCILKTSRSCHGKCNFCEGYLFDQLNPGCKYRAKSAKRICDEMQNVIDKYGCRIFVISDDNFFVEGKNGKERAWEWVKLLKDRNIRIKFTIECRADDVDPDIMSELKKVGLYKVYIGLESGSQRVLNRYKKGITVKQNCYALETLRKYSIKCHPGHILFDPMTTKEELRDTADFFLEYMDTFFIMDRKPNRELFFPSGCDLKRIMWPKGCATIVSKRYDGIAEEHLSPGEQYPFFNKEIYEIYNRFMELQQDTNRYYECNVLEKRFRCLKDSLKI